MGEVRPTLSFASGVPRAILRFGVCLSCLFSVELCFADIPTIPIIARIEATSLQQSKYLAFDANAATAWCPGKRDTIGELVMTFPDEIKIKSLVIYAGQFNVPRSKAGYRPTSMKITVGGLQLDIDAAEVEDNGQNPLEIKGIKGVSAQRLSFRLLPANEGQQRCLSEVIVELDVEAWLYGLPQKAANELTAFVRQLSKAMRSCDRHALKELAKFPLVRRELSVGFAGAETHYSRTPPGTYKNVQALTSDCQSLVYPEGESPSLEPRISRSVAESVVRVEANHSGGVKYWHLSWVKNRWWLTGIELQDFE